MLLEDSFGVKSISKFVWDLEPYIIFSSAVPSGSGAFQMPSAAAASTLRGGRANLRNASVTFSLFWHEASLG